MFDKHVWKFQTFPLFYGGFEKTRGGGGENHPHHARRRVKDKRGTRV